jgi:hypothetical protein
MRAAASGVVVTATRCPGVKLLARGLNGAAYSTSAAPLANNTSH